MNSDQIAEYLAIRNSYVGELRDAGMLNRQGNINREILVEDVAIPVEGSSLDRHCQKYPNDPPCWMVSGENRMDKLTNLREEFISELEEKDLLSVQRAVSDFVVATGSGTVLQPGASVGLVSPDDPNADDLINDPVIGPLVQSHQLNLRLMW